MYSTVKKDQKMLKKQEKSAITYFMYLALPHEALCSCYMYQIFMLSVT